MANDVARLARIRRWCATGEARRRRKDAGLSLMEVAEAIGVNLTTVHRWENGSHRPRRSAALRYLAALEQAGRVQ